MLCYFVRVQVRMCVHFYIPKYRLRSMEKVVWRVKNRCPVFVCIYPFWGPLSTISFLFLMMFICLTSGLYLVFYPPNMWPDSNQCNGMWVYFRHVSRLFYLFLLIYFLIRKLLFFQYQTILIIFWSSVVSTKPNITYMVDVT